MVLTVIILDSFRKRIVDRNTYDEYIFLDMDIIALIKVCDMVEDVQQVESSFHFTAEEQDAANNRKLVLILANLEQYLVMHGGDWVNPDLMEGWSSDEREAFLHDWGDDSFLTTIPEAPNNGSMDSLLPEIPSQAEGSHVGELPGSYQSGGKRKRDDVGETSKRQKPEDYFTIKPGKQVSVRKFRTTGMFNCSAVL